MYCHLQSIHRYEFRSEGIVDFVEQTRDRCSSVDFRSSISLLVDSPHSDRKSRKDPREMEEKRSETTTVQCWMGRSSERHGCFSATSRAIFDIQIGFRWRCSTRTTKNSSEWSFSWKFGHCRSRFSERISKTTKQIVETRDVHRCGSFEFPCCTTRLFRSAR